MKKRNGIWYVERLEQLFGWEVLETSRKEGDPYLTLKIHNKSTEEIRTVKAIPSVVPAASLERTSGRK